MSNILYTCCGKVVVLGQSSIYTGGKYKEHVKKEGYESTDARVGATTI